MEDAAHLTLDFMRRSLVLQAAISNGVSFDPFSFQQDGLTASDVDVGWRGICASSIALGEDLAVIERDLARSALADENVARLMAIPGVDTVVALAVIAAIGDMIRFGEPEESVNYHSLNPSVRQSGPGPAHHGRIIKQGRGHACGMLVEAAWAAARAPGSVGTVTARAQTAR